MEITKHKYNWNGTLTKTQRKPARLIHHHTAGSEKDVYQIHNSHVAMGDKGFPYHFAVFPNGTVHQGRPLGTWGAHTLGYNDDVGIVAVGKFHLFPMGLKQRRALRELTRYIHSLYPGIKDYRHGTLNATACPGRFYPFGYITKPAPTILARKLRAQLKRRMVVWAVHWNGQHLDDKFEIPPVNVTSTAWGSPAKLLAKRVSYRLQDIDKSVEVSEKPTVALFNALQ